jgi:Bacteriophage clamp loader A subunit
MAELGDFLNSINKNKKDLINDPESDPIVVEKEYKKLSFVINRCLSYFPDTVFYAQEMNMRSHLDGKPQYEFYLHGVSPKSRWSKGIKIENPDDLEVVKEYYGYSSKKAREALKILSPEDIEYIQARLFRGGVGKKKK